MEWVNQSGLLCISLSATSFNDFTIKDSKFDWALEGDWEESSWESSSRMELMYSTILVLNSAPTAALSILLFTFKVFSVIFVLSFFGRHLMFRKFRSIQELGDHSVLHLLLFHIHYKLQMWSFY